MTIQGRFNGVTGQWGSSLGILLIGEYQIPCEMRLTIHALDSMGAILGDSIVAVVDSIGCLAELAPADDGLYENA